MCYMYTTNMQMDIIYYLYIHMYLLQINNVCKELIIIEKTLVYFKLPEQPNKRMSKIHDGDQTYHFVLWNKSNYMFSYKMPKRDTYIQQWERVLVNTCKDIFINPYDYIILPESSYVDRVGQVYGLCYKMGCLPIILNLLWNFYTVQTVNKLVEKSKTIVCNVFSWYHHDQSDWIIAHYVIENVCLQIMLVKLYY